MADIKFAYPFDPKGTAVSNKITNELQTISPPAWKDYYFILPKLAPYFRSSMKVWLHPSGKELKEGVDYVCSHLFHDATLAVGKPVYGSLTFYDKTLNGVVRLEYQTIGGEWTVDAAEATAVLVNTSLNPRITTWEQVINVPDRFPVIDHEWNLDDMVGMTEVEAAIKRISDVLLTTGDPEVALDDHLLRKDNPHDTNKTHVGLSEVQNYPIATTEQAEIGDDNESYMTPRRTYQAIVKFAHAYTDTHANRKDNPHGVTPGKIGTYTSAEIDQLIQQVSVRDVTATDTARFGGMTPEEFVDSLNIDNTGITDALAGLNQRVDEIDKESVGLGSVNDFPMSNETESRQGIRSDAYMSPLRTQQNFEENTKNVRGYRGDVLFMAEDDVPMAFNPGALMRRDVAIVEGQTEMDTLKGYVESFDQVFTEWLRISHDSSDVFPANPAELDQWNYDATEGRVTATVNSSTMIGFVSPERHEDFVFEATLRSTAADDDSIGLCFGFVTQDGIEHTLTAMRTPGGTQGHEVSPGNAVAAKLLDVYYDYLHPIRRLDLGSTNGGLAWGDGVVDDLRVPPGDLGAGGWAAHPDGCRLKIERFGDVFTISTSNFGEADYLETATVVVDINDYPELEAFRGPIQFGYVCFSQANSTWEVHRRPVELGTVVDAETLETWSWDGAKFAMVSPDVARENILPNRFYYTAMTQKMFYNDSFRGLMRISG